MCVLIDRTKKRYYGYGASLDEAYAIERSLLEALQMFHAKKTVKLNKLWEWPELLEIGECNIDQCRAANQFQYRSFGLYSRYPTASLSTMINSLVVLLKEKNLHIYAHKIYEHKQSKICLVRCFMPDAEEFLTLLEGEISIPRKRAERLIKESQRSTASSF